MASTQEQHTGGHWHKVELVRNAHRSGPISKGTFTNCSGNSQGIVWSAVGNAGNSNSPQISKEHHVLSKTNIFSDRSHWHRMNHIGRQTASLPKCFWRRKLGQNGPNNIHSVEDHLFGTLTLPLQRRKWLASKPRQRHHIAWWLASNLRPLARKYQIYRKAELPQDKSGYHGEANWLGSWSLGPPGCKDNSLVCQVCVTLSLHEVWWGAFAKSQKTSHLLRWQGRFPRSIGATFLSDLLLRHSWLATLHHVFALN